MVENDFVIGPDQPDDLRFQRPYFLLPLQGSDETRAPVATVPLAAVPQGKAQGETGGAPVLAEEEARLLAWARKMEERQHPVTDVFIFSHGWHRNLLGAVSAYDRLLSRYSLLWHSGRLPVSDSLQDGAPEPLDGEPEENFSPLFIGLHWHSDPGQDGWVDAEGRRSKADFLRNVEALFRSVAPSTKVSAAAAETVFARDFEDLFEVMSQISAPGKDAVSDHAINERALALTWRLHNYVLKVAPAASQAEKVTALWRCYFEAEPRGLFLDQSEKPGLYLTLGKAMGNLAQFIFGAVGLGVVVGPLLGALGRISNWLPSPAQVLQWFKDLGASLSQSPAAFASRNGDEFGAWLGSVWDARFQALEWLAWPVVAWLVSMAILGLASRYKLRTERILKARRQGEQKREQKREAGEPEPGQPAHALHEQKFQPTGTVPDWMLLVPWLYAQLVCTLPLAVYGLLSYSLGLGLIFTWVGRKLKLRSSYDERLGERGAPPPSMRVREGAYVSERLVRGRFKHVLSALARWPLAWAQKAASADGSVMRWASQLDSYLAFFDMQGRGVECGALAAEKIAALVEHSSSLQNARLHFIGHSFGALVVCNTARHLAMNREFKGRLGSLCLLEAALASNWFEGEATLQQKMPVIAAIYSRYDSANGFYFPFANVGRYAAGYVGLLDEAPHFVPHQRGFYASLVRPPELGLGHALHEEKPIVVNIDASRLITGGSITSGGSHTLVYRDDVLHLVWAVVRLARRARRKLPDRP